MASYYYLISSLPTLKADDEMPFSYDKFLESCKSAVSASVYERLENLSVTSDKGPMLKEWGEFYNSLMKDLNYERRLALGKKATASEDRDSERLAVIRNAMKAKNPLEAEGILMEYEFAKLDNLVSMHYFDDYVLFGYAIKMKLLERKTIFNKEEGKAEFNRLFENLQQQIQAI